MQKNLIRISPAPLALAITIGSLAVTMVVERLSAAPLFMTQHSPMGAWSSLTFGLPGGGVGIETEALGIKASGDLLVACSRGSEHTDVFPFFTSDTTDDYEGRVAGNAAPKAFRDWKPVSISEFSRKLTPATDEFSGAGIRLRVTSPRLPLPNNLADGAMSLAALPALLIEVEIDNTGYDVAATGFIGLAYKGAGRMRPLDWADPGLVGVAYQDHWALAALPAPDVFTIRAGSIASCVQEGRGLIHPGGNEGGIGFRVPPHSKRTLTAVFAFYRAGSDVAQGRSLSYAYTAQHASVEQVSHAALVAANQLRAAAQAYDEKLAPVGADPLAIELLAQASQGYYANTSLLRDAKSALHWSVCEGQFGWRNTLDLSIDHLPFELTVHPWVAGNVIDGFIDAYSYHDQIRFDGETKAFHPGGISFTHDQGNYTAYSPPGKSGYEQPDREGVYSFMTTEQLLNGAYCAAAYAVKGGDTEWKHRRLPVAREILVSMENREHVDPARRDGILRGQSDHVGTGKEITTYDALDHALQNSRGSLYIVIKTWCAAVMLEHWFTTEGDEDSAHRAAAIATRAATSLMAGFDQAKGAFPANLLDGGDSRVIAALDPLAVPLFCGLSGDLRRYSSLLDQLRTHARTCLLPGNCTDAKSGGLRLSSTATNTWPSKVALTLSGLGWLEGRTPREAAPEAYSQLAHWMQVSAKQTTVSDQIDASDGKCIGGSYYPRLVTVQTLVSPTVAR